MPWQADVGRVAEARVVGERGVGRRGPRRARRGARLASGCVFRLPGHCGGVRSSIAGSGRWRCANGHSFDVARQGYVALERKAARGDTAEMVAARVAFLEAGHYAPIAERGSGGGGPARGARGRPRAGGGEGGGGGARRAARAGGPSRRSSAVAARRAVPRAVRTVVDLGRRARAYYLGRGARHDTQPDARGVALDSSRPALRRAARAHPRITAVACDAWDALPLQDGVADVVLNVFAPRNPGEMRRVLKPGGRIVVVTPTDAPPATSSTSCACTPRSASGCTTDLGTPETERDLEFTLELDDVTPLVQMGPSAHHDLQRQGPQTVTVSVTVTDVQGLSVPSKLPDPQVSGQLEAVRERVGRVDDELVEAR